MKIKFTLFIYALVGLMAIAGCNETGDSNNNNQDSLNTVSDTNQTNTTIYLIPSPEDMFAFTQDKKLTFNNKVLNATENKDKYIDTRSKELNFGAYSADMAYSAAFSKYQESVKYLNVVRSLSDDIGIAAVFNESLVKRIENIIENKDSLITVSSDAYYDIVKFLEKNQRTRTLAMISTGGWVESLYIVTNLVDKYNAKDPTIQLIADQKIIFNNLMLYLEQSQNDAAIKTTIDELAPVKAVFDKLEVVKVENGQNNSNNSNAIVVGGGTKITISEEQFKELKAAITKVRNNITGNL